MKYQVYYMRPEFFAHGIMGIAGLRAAGKLPTLARLTDTHVELGSFEARDLEDLFRKMQGEFWSPNGEARNLIMSKGLCHTSMSVGDIAIDETGNGSIVADFGWERVE
jgi:hypothetical protein